MTKTEITHLLDLLDNLDDRYSTDGCNDMTLKDTPENREFYTAMDEWQASRDKYHERMPVEQTLHEPYHKKGPKVIYTSNITVLGYLVSKLKAEHGIE